MAWGCCVAARTFSTRPSSAPRKSTVWFPCGPAPVSTSSCVSLRPAHPRTRRAQGLACHSAATHTPLHCGLAHPCTRALHWLALGFCTPSHGTLAHTCNGASHTVAHPHSRALAPRSYTPSYSLGQDFARICTRALHAPCTRALCTLAQGPCTRTLPTPQHPQDWLHPPPPAHSHPPCTSYLPPVPRATHPQGHPVPPPGHTWCRCG